MTHSNCTLYGLVESATMQRKIIVHCIEHKANAHVQRYTRLFNCLYASMFNRRVKHASHPLPVVPIIVTNDIVTFHSADLVESTRSDVIKIVLMFNSLETVIMHVQKKAHHPTKKEDIYKLPGVNHETAHWTK